MKRAGRFHGNAVAEVIDPTAGLAYPKLKPQGEPINYRDLAIAKAVPERNERYLDYIRGHVCLVNGTHHHECGGRTEAAHIEGHGTGIKADDTKTVPLCSHHHAHQHRMGILTFQQNYNVDLEYEAARLRAGYRAKGIA